MVEFVLPVISPPSLNIEVLSILTDVAFQLNPKLTIANTTQAASVRWKQHHHQRKERGHLVVPHL